LDKKWGAPTVVHDGVAVAKEIELKDHSKTWVPSSLKKPLQKPRMWRETYNYSHTLAQSIINKGFDKVNTEVNPMILKVGIEKE